MFRAQGRCEHENAYQIIKNQTGDSVSTEGSSSPRSQDCQRVRRHNKEKLELCKKYTEFGYCPYQKRCKFAHGHHELRKNNTTNIRYKTKQCVTYIKNGYCHYGSRCNFIHKQQPQVQIEVIPTTVKSNYRDIFYSLGQESRLMTKILK